MKRRHRRRPGDMAAYKRAFMGDSSDTTAATTQMSSTFPPSHRSLGNVARTSFPNGVSSFLSTLAALAAEVMATASALCSVLGRGSSRSAGSGRPRC